MICSLDEALAYENDEVVHRFASDYRVSIADAREIFVETKRWLWLCASHVAEANDGVGDKVPLLGEARVIDLMWHTFLLFTKDYAAYCRDHFGFFVHHQPRLRAEKEAWERKVAEDREAALAERRQTLRKGYEDVCKRLGQATLRKWCEEFPARFALEA